MCIIQGEVIHVNKTKILAVVEGKTQLTMYGNTVAFKEHDTNNAMILPVPAPSDQVKFNLPLNDEKAKADVEKLFELCEDPFRPPVSKGKKSRGNALQSTNDSDESMLLEVHQVGSYKVSKAPTAHDLGRINPTVFVVQSDILEILQKRYSTGFCFLIFQMDKTKTYHPFAYVHPLLPSGSVFIPTLHIHDNGMGHHDGRNHKKSTSSHNMRWESSSFASSRPSVVLEKKQLSATRPKKKVQLEQVSDDWDHAIYVIGASIDSKASKNWNSENRMDEILSVEDSNNSQFYKHASRLMHLKSADSTAFELQKVATLLHRYGVSSHLNLNALCASSPKIYKFSCTGKYTNGDLLMTMVNAGTGFVGSGNQYSSTILSTPLVIASPVATTTGARTLVHEDVQCDVCNTYPIRGIKYRCIVCPDTDICDACVSAGKHLVQHPQFPQQHLTTHPLARIELLAQMSMEVNKRKVPSSTTATSSFSSQYQNTAIVCNACRTVTSKTGGTFYYCTMCNLHLCASCDQLTDRHPRTHTVMRQIFG